MSEHPDFLIVCDHGVSGGELDPVARFEWGQHGWQYLPLQFTAATLSPLKGDEHSHAHLGDEATRLHYEIPCQNQRCFRRAYRSDEAKLQTLLDVIAHNDKFQGLTEITLTLDALHYARDTAKQRGLRV